MSRLELALIDQLHHRVCEYRLGERRAVHDGVRGQRIALGVTDAVGVDIADLAVIDHRNGHALGVGMGHDLATSASMAAPVGIVCAAAVMDSDKRMKSAAVWRIFVLVDAFRGGFKLTSLARAGGDSWHYRLEQIRSIE